MIRRFLIAAFFALAIPAHGAFNTQGLWWNAAESGWGLNIDQQGEILFMTWFTYDDDGGPLWLVMPNTRSFAADCYQGPILRTEGPAFNAAPFLPSQVTEATLGYATICFSSPTSAQFDVYFYATGTSRSRSIQPQQWAQVRPECVVGGTQGPVQYYQDIWWNGAGESGWGVNIAHQRNAAPGDETLFVTWFTYGPARRGVWYVGSAVTKTADRTYSGALYRTTGPSHNLPT